MVRFKNRYLLVEAIPATPGPFPSDIHGAFVRSLRRLITNLFGGHGIGSMGRTIQLKYFNTKTGIAIIRCPRDHFRLLWGALFYLREVGGVQCTMRVLHVSGTIRCCQEVAVKRSRKLMLLACKMSKEIEERRRLEREEREEERKFDMIDP